MGKQQKSRRRRNVNRTPRPMGRQSGSLHEAQHVCLPHQSPGPGAPVHRDQIELVDGRAYPATARMNVEGEVMKFDLIANMYAVIRGEVTGPCAGILVALTQAYMEDHPGMLTSLSPDEKPPLTIAALTDSFRRFFDEGIIGRDEKGGYINFDRLHAAHA